MLMPLVTIGIINYNCLKYLEKCVDSYLNQSYQNIEIIIVDDCSTDGSVDKIKELEHCHKNISCIYHEKNSGGPSQAIQEVIKQARGKYFQWIASDDYVNEDAIKKFVDYLEKTNKDYVYCKFNIIDENNTVRSRWNYSLPTLNEMVYRIFTNCSGVIPMNGLYRLEFFRKKDITWSVYRNNEYSCDTINSLNFIKNGMDYGIIKESLIYYRLHQNNYSHNIEHRIKTSFIVYDYIIKNFNEEIYFPAIDWKNSENREQLKNYIIASYFYKKITDFLKLETLPKHIKYSITKEKLAECVSAAIEEGRVYICQGLTQGDTLRKELVELEKSYNNLLL
ncbi:glycosyltransferase family 2 protein [Ruminiclostridium herbifermentans]|uniref:Glycosyltransferase family 2 protein n=1 Tax=Ruminiclostridium herbifermentans TaxID=2488810 RepID=A0A4U7J9D3_9FIRM|nr:glycosyltransferase family 2 protein [Ruminiclostridium herbifermentans]QNU66875.1 glycosyltransferase family 2 protein [Ruminiclostridium herbifermentans]